MPEKWVLRQYQSLPLRAKVGMTENRIIEWYDHFNGQVCVSFSGGKDSTVLAHLVHQYFPDVPLVFANTGLEYPEIQAFARKMGAVFVRPKMSFPEVISKYGYPIISKENAEAIYYARRIRNKTDHSLIGGGGATTDRKRNEFNGLRTVATRHDGMETGQPDEHTLGHEENRLRSECGGGYRHTLAKRTEFAGLRTWKQTDDGAISTGNGRTIQTAATSLGVIHHRSMEQTGTIGEEEPSPG